MTTASAIFPPLVVLILGYKTKRVMLSLCAGILLAALIANDFSIIASLSTVASCILGNLQLSTFFSVSHFTETWNLFICIFLLCLGVFVVMLQTSGGAQSYINKIQNKVTSAKGAEQSSLILSLLLFIDDYFSSLTVGSVMRPLTDSYKIPRAKLAFLVDSMAAPLAILCPFSSWVAAIIGFLKDNGISQTSSPSTLVLGSPVTAYTNLIPFLFYSFVIMISVFFIVNKRISFSAILSHEKLAKKGQLIEDLNFKEKDYNNNNSDANIYDFITPVLVLLSCVLLGVLYSGNWFLFGGENSTLTAFQNSSAAFALFLGGTISLLITTVFFLRRKRFKTSQLPSIFYNGVMMMLPAVTVLMLAWSLGDLLRNDLHTGEYIAELLSNKCDITLLPFVLFFLAAMISFAIGSSWGTAAMLFPIVIPMSVSFIDNSSTSIPLSEAALLYPILGAVLSGCVAGDHISPISDTSIMSSTSSGSPLIEHIKTQLPLSIPAILSTGLAFLLAPHLVKYGFIVTSIVCISMAVIIACALLQVFNKNR